MIGQGLLRAADAAVLRKLRPEARPVQHAATAVSEAAKGGRFWIAVSALGAISPRTRPAAGAGLAAWGTASALAFGTKAVVRRRRPRLAGFGSAPRSSSMPSSHTASAVAYATAAIVQAPVLGLVLLPVSGAVAWSRAATARHFPTDVAAGAALGLVVGTATGVAVRVGTRRVQRAADELSPPER